MNLETLRKTLLNKKRTTEETPFGPEALVYKVMGKMYALIAWEEDPLHLTLKCEPDFALALRAQYPAIKAGYHMNKKHWNTVRMDGRIPNPLLEALVRHAHALVHPVYRKSAGNFIHLP